MSNILFICKSDRIAGKLAAAYLSHRLAELGGTDFHVSSAGMSVRRGDGMPPEAEAVLRENGCHADTIGAVQLGLKDIRQADLIVCLADEIYKEVTGGYKSARGKTVTLMSMVGVGRDVFEPRSNAEACRQCLEMMRPALDRMAERLI